MSIGKSIGAVLLLALAASAAAGPVPSNSDESSACSINERQLHHGLVYARKRGASVKEISPEQTREELEKLRGCYAGQNDVISLDRFKKLSNLLDAANVNEAKCSQGSQLLAYNKLIERNVAFIINLVPYLLHHRQAQYNLCKPMLDEQFKGLVHNRVQPSHRAQVEELRRDVIGEKSEILAYVPHENMVNGLARFIERHASDASLSQVMRANENSFGRFEEMFDSVTEMCIKVMDRLSPLMEVYESMDSEYLGHSDSFTIDWINSNHVCLSMMSERSQLAREVYEKIKTGA